MTTSGMKCQACAWTWDVLYLDLGWNVWTRDDLRLDLVFSHSKWTQTVSGGNGLKILTKESVLAKCLVVSPCSAIDEGVAATKHFP